MIRNQSDNQSGSQSNSQSNSQSRPLTVKQRGKQAGSFSRRKALQLLASGAVGGLLAEVTQGIAPVQAQSIYLPSLNNAAVPPVAGDDELCDPECSSAAVLDLSWFRRHLLNEILPKWLKAVTSQGLFLPHFDRQWRPLNRNFGTLVSQGRLLYNFSQGYALTGDQTYRNAVAGGTQFLLNHFRDSKYGGWYWSCNLDGSVKDRRKELYGHAFVIFGLSHAYKCTGDTALPPIILQTWNVVKSHFRDAYGGYFGRMTEDFKVSGTTKSENPMMHLFEALMAAATVGGQPQLLDEARIVGNFILDKLVRPRDHRLPENYDMQWKELSGSNGGQLELGHAFEWAYLADRGVELGLPGRFHTFANSFLTDGMALGYDRQNGGIFSPARPDGVLINEEKGWWQQCETIRALVHFYLRFHRNELNGPLQNMLEFVKAQFIDPQYGGWYTTIGPGIDPRTQEKGNEWKVDYHVVGMCMEAIRLTAKAAEE
jgi:mannose/cellobiose epimerase-like protein (N-acyl-D-glucosamine 2-epimerase family)